MINTGIDKLGRFSSTAFLTKKSKIFMILVPGGMAWESEINDVFESIIYFLSHRSSSKLAVSKLKPLSKKRHTEAQNNLSLTNLT
jgi:hypothetical protein